MENLRINNKAIIGAVAGNIYRMHPYHLPEGIDKIIGHLVKTMDELPDSCNSINDTFKVFAFKDFKDFRDWLENILKEVPEFFELNVSKALKDKGIKYGDSENKGVVFTSRYDKTGLNKRYTDFIDLDALIQNIVCEINSLQKVEDDCFLCKYAKEYGSTEPSGCEKCIACICNPVIRYNREHHPMSLKPHNQWTEEEKQKYNLD